MSQVASNDTAAHDERPDITLDPQSDEARIEAAERCIRALQAFSQGLHCAALAEQHGDAVSARRLRADAHAALHRYPEILAAFYPTTR